MAPLISKESDPFLMRDFLAEYEGERDTSGETFGYLLGNLGRHLQGFRPGDDGRPSATPIALPDFGIPELKEYYALFDWGGSQQHTLLSAIKCNLRWQGFTGNKLHHDPIAETHHPLLTYSIKGKYRKPKPQRWLAPDKYQLALQIAATMGHRAWRNRNVAILVTYWQTLVRASELCRIDLDYVDLKRREYKVETKAITHEGRGWETKRLFPANIEAINLWLADRREYCEVIDPTNPVAAQRGALFVNHSGIALTRDGNQCVLRRIGIGMYEYDHPELRQAYKDGEISKDEFEEIRYESRFKLSPHDLRRGGIAHMLNMGVPDRLVMLQSGHRTYSEFKKYTEGVRLSALDQWFGDEDPDAMYKAKYGWKTLDEMVGKGK
ncbi:MAG: site-specific integrase [Chloroflexi bacterium]|nr:site-specific integrase [Chloroflexota bacterium]